MEQNEIKIDGKREDGFGAKALVVIGHAGCSGIDVVDILEKMRVDFSDFTIEAEAEQTEEHPKVFKDILITYKMKNGQMQMRKSEKSN